MRMINFNDKTFSLIANSKNGAVGAETIFKFKQEGNLVTADYEGGGIVYGKIIAKLVSNELQMLYQCLNTANELRAGKAIAQISFNAEDKIKLRLKWEWLEGDHNTGVSEYIEN